MATPIRDYYKKDQTYTQGECNTLFAKKENVYTKSECDEKYALAGSVSGGKKRYNHWRFWKLVDPNGISPYTNNPLERGTGIMYDICFDTVSEETENIFTAVDNFLNNEEDVESSLYSNAGRFYPCTGMVWGVPGDISSSTKEPYIVVGLIVGNKGNPFPGSIIAYKATQDADQGSGATARQQIIDKSYFDFDVLYSEYCGVNSTLYVGCSRTTVVI